MMWGRFLLLLFTIFSIPSMAVAHELRPAYLAITETENLHYDILWKTPALGDKQLALKAVFPQNCAISNGRRHVEKNRFAIETWKLTCPQSLKGQSLTIGGLEKTLTDVLVRVQWANRDHYTTRLTPEKPYLNFAQDNEQDGVIKTYFVYGVQHILEGVDHLLFVLAVMLLITQGRKLIWAITAFTLGHSVTLALASLDIIRLNGSIVELLIAMSIVLMAYEAARHQRGQSGLTLEYPWLVTFSFGLLHGFGFAGALRSIGLPQEDLPAALLFFNIGVEAGQILFMSAVLLVISIPVLKNFYHKQMLTITTSYIIGTMAVFWMIERVIPVFSPLVLLG